MTRSATAALVLLLQAALAPGALAQLEPVGPQFVVNDYTTGRQLGPLVAFDDDGGVFVVWSGEGNEAFDTWARRFRPDGVPVGAEIGIPASEEQWSVSSALERLGAGFLLLRTQGLSGVPPIRARVEAQALDPAGAPLGAPFVVSQTTAYNLSARSITRGSGGGFVVTWHAFGSSGEWDDSDVFVRWLDAAGAPVGSSFQVNADSPYAQHYPDSTAAGAAGYVVVWNALEGDLLDQQHGVVARRFDSLGTPVGTPLVVASERDVIEEPAVAGRPDGSFVVAWSEFDGTDDTFQDIRVRRYGSDGAPVGAELQANVFTTQSQNHPEVAIDASGSFHVIWSSAAGAPPIDEGILARSFRADGSPLGAEYRIGDSLQAASARPELAVRADGRAWVAWTDGSSAEGYDGLDGDRSGVLARPMWVAGQCRDLDGDGYGAPGAADCGAGPATDCDDGDGAVNPGAVEIPANGVDDDCDPSTPTGCNAEEL